MSLIEIDSVDDSLHRLIDRGVLKNNVGRFSTQFEGQLGAPTGKRFLDQLPHLGGAGESHLIQAGMVHQRRAGGSRPRHQTENSLGQAGFLTDFSKQQGRQRGCFCRLQHHGVSTGQGGGDLPGHHQEGKVPWDDLPCHTNRTHRLTGKGITQLVRPTGMVKEMGGRERDIDVAGFADRLSPIHRFHHRKLPGPLLDNSGDPIKIFSALSTRQLAPHFVIGRAGGFDRLIDILLPAIGHLGDHFFIGGIDGFKPLPRNGRNKFPSDEETVVILQLEMIGTLGCRGVSPVRTHRG